VDATSRFDVQLQVGKASTSVTVNDEARCSRRIRADVSTHAHFRRTRKLPILDRNLTSLLVALPGAGRIGASQSGTSGAEISRPITRRQSMANSPIRTASC